MIGMFITNTMDSAFMAGISKYAVADFFGLAGGDEKEVSVNASVRL